MSTRVEIPILTADEVRQIIREELERMQTQDRLLEAREAAEYLAVKPRTIWAWRKEGRLPYVEISPGSYRFRESDLKTFVSERTKKQPRPAEYAAGMLRGCRNCKGEHT